MTTKIYDLDDNIDFKEINLDNSTLLATTVCLIGIFFIL